MTGTSNKVSPVNAGGAFQGDGRNRVIRLQQEFVELLCQVLAVANISQYPRKLVAFKLGLTVSAIDSCVRKHTRQHLTSANLLGLLCLRGESAALSEPARLLLWQRLGEMGGMVCVPEEAAKLDKSPVQQQVCEIGAAFGLLCNVAGESRLPVDAAAMSGEQLAAAVRAVDAVQRQTAELRSALDGEVARRANGQMGKLSNGQIGKGGGR